jgi:hypothetical protein
VEAVILYPAIDLKDGRCVRLVKGAMDSATVFNDSPADQAARFAADGFEWLHVVDLNGAIEGRSANAQAVSAILAATKAPFSSAEACAPSPPSRAGWRPASACDPRYGGAQQPGTGSRGGQALPRAGGRGH